MLYSFNNLSRAHRPIAIISEKQLAQSEQYLTLGRTLYQAGTLDRVYLVGTRFEGMALNDIDQNELEAMLYRQALGFNPNNAQALNELGSCIFEGATIEKTDLRGSRFERLSLETINKDDIAALFYRQAIATNPDYPDYPDFIFNLTTCLRKEGVTIEKKDLEGTVWESQLPERVNRLELEAELHRKILAIDSNYSLSLFALASCIGKGASIASKDLEGTPFQGQAPKHINRYKLLTELYRKVIALNPHHIEARLHVGVDIVRGAPFLEEDLKGTRWEGTPLREVNRIALLADLFRAIISMAPHHPKRYEAIGNLAVCILNGAILQENDLRYSLFEGQSIDKVHPIEWVACVVRNLMGLKDYRKGSVANLCVCLERGARLWAEDVLGTEFENKILHTLDIHEVVRAIKKREERPLPILLESDELVVHPEEFLCPISHRLMRYPVFTSDGQVYDKDSITAWFAIKNTSPLTNEILENITLVPHINLQGRIEQYIDSLKRQEASSGIKLGK